MWGISGQEIVISQPHDTHPEVSHMKTLVRSYVWWPELDSDIVAKVRECETCQKNRPIPVKAPLHPWEWKLYLELHYDVMWISYVYVIRPKPF